MKSLYGNTVSEQIQFDEVGGATSRPYIKTQYYGNDLAWHDFDDVVSRSITLSNENKRYLSFSFVPPSKELELVLNNASQIYSTGSGNAKASILKKNLLIKCYTGYELSATSPLAVSASISSGKNYHTWLTGGVLYASTGAFVGTISKYAMFNTYDRFNYGDRSYSPSGYYQGRHDFTSTARDSYSSIVITSNSDKISARYKVGFDGWSPWTNLVNGVNTIGIDSPADSKSLDYILRWDIPQWGNTAGVSAITINTQRKGYLFERGTFLSDDPEYSDTVQIKGRDYLKKGLETEINLPTWTNRPIHSALTDIFDRCSIPYDTDNWDATSGVITVNASLAEDLGAVSGWKALDYLMDASNACSDDWLLKWEGDGSMSLKKVPTDIEADWVADYRYNIESIQKNFNAEKQLQRITVVNKDIPCNSERLLATITGSNATGSATWASGALYIRYVDNVGNLSSETSRTFTSVGVSFSSTASHNVSVYGAPYRSIKSWQAFAERSSVTNLINSDGNTYKLINPFLNSTQALALANKLLTLWEEPQKKITLSMSTNPYLEMNDNVTVFDFFTYTDDIYAIREIKEDFTGSRLKDSITLIGKGFDIGRMVYDRNGYYEGINDVQYDKGFVYDQDLKIGGEDVTVYDKPIRRS